MRFDSSLSFSQIFSTPTIDKEPFFINVRREMFGKYWAIFYRDFRKARLQNETGGGEFLTFGRRIMYHNSVIDAEKKNDHP